MVVREKYTAECEWQENTQKNSKCRFTTELELKKNSQGNHFESYILFFCYTNAVTKSPSQLSLGHTLMSAGVEMTRLGAGTLWGADRELYPGIPALTGLLIFHHQFSFPCLGRKLRQDEIF